MIGRPFRPRVAGLAQAQPFSVVSSALVSGEEDPSTCAATCALRIADSALTRSTLSCSWSTSFSIFVLLSRLTIGFSRLATCTERELQFCSVGRK